jgi:steroid delta-isomerase-like uncharacterized protein
MTRDAIAALFARRDTAWGNEDAAALAADYAADAVIESPTAGVHRGPVAAQHGFDSVFTTFTDMTLHVESLLIDGDRVAQVLTIEGTNMGGIMGLPPSDKAFRVPAVFLYELRGDKISRERRIYDFTGLLVQVGVLKARPA